MSRLGGFVRTSSLSLFFGGMFVVTLVAHDFAGWRQLNADFWSRTLQNWQSEFLAIGTMAVFSIYLRERGSPESKPVGQPHASTGVEG